MITTLSSKGIKARIENEYQELLKDPTCNLLLDLISCSQGKRDPLIWENISNFYGNINGIDEFTDELILAKSYKEIDNTVSDITYLISNFIPNEESMLKLIDCIIEKDEKRIISNFSTYNGKSDLIFTYCKLRNNRSQNNRNINEIYSLLIQSSLVDVVN